MGIASTLRGRRGPCQAWDHTDPVVGSSKGSRVDCRPFAACFGVVVVVGGRVGVGGSGAVVELGPAGGLVLDTVRGRIRLGLGHRPYRLGRRTLVLYSRNQPRTNIVPRKEKTEWGGDSLPSCSI